MMSKKMAELEDDFREFKAHTERRFVSLDMSIRAYRLEEDQRHEEEDQRHEERIRRYDELKNLLLSLIQKSSSPVQSSRPITTKVPTKPTECVSSYGDFGCLSPNNMTDFEEDEKCCSSWMVLHGIRLVIRTVLMVDSITFGHEMVNILVLGEEYDKVFNHLDMLNAPFEGKVFTCAKQVKPYTEVPLQSSSVSSDFATQFLNLDNVPPADNEIISMMNVDVRHEEPCNQTPSLLTIHVTVIPEISIASAITIPPPIPPPHQSTPTPIPTATTILVLPDFSTLFEFNQRVSNLEKGLSELKQANQYA
ncbi:hypothetical protein Tco_1109135 [Tanacetum coccineum]